MTTYAGAALMLFATLGTAIASYTVNLHVAGERAAVRQLRADLGAQTRQVLSLQAELRTRARLPEMQRWNDNVFKMAAPSATQFLRSPVQLASFVAPAAPPPVQYAVATAPADAAPEAASVVVRTGYAPPPAATTAASPAPAQLVRASYERGAGTIADSVAADLASIAAPAAPAR